MSPDLILELNPGYTGVLRSPGGKPSQRIVLVEEGKVPEDPPTVHINPESREERGSLFSPIVVIHENGGDARLNIVHSIEGKQRSETLPEAVTPQPGESVSFSRGKIVHGEAAAPTEETL